MDLLTITDLHTSFDTDRGIIHAVYDTGFSVKKGETVALVGESGCGKSVTALSIMGLIPKEQGSITDGSIKFNGIDLTTVSAKDYRSLRGKRISMVFQDPMTSLNPYLTIASQMVEVFTVHSKISRKEALQHSIKMLAQVGIPDPRRLIRDFPHRFSGGMRQKVLIAMALLLQPELLIADEPTTALDVTVQARVLDLLRGYGSSHRMGILLITHDMGIAAEMADRVIVMYAGTIVEKNSTTGIFRQPAHPYTAGLLESVPDIDTETEISLKTIPGYPPVVYAIPDFCPFVERCNRALPVCSNRRPVLEKITDVHYLACFNPVTVLNEEK